MRTECFLFVHHTTSTLAKLTTWRFEHSGDISCSLLVNPSHTDESWEGTIYTYMCTLTLHVFLFEIGVTKHKLNKLDCEFTIHFVDLCY